MGGGDDGFHRQSAFLLMQPLPELKRVAPVLPNLRRKEGRMSAGDTSADEAQRPVVPAGWLDLAAAQDVFCRNLQQQEAVNHQQATNVLKLAFVARAVSLIEQAGYPEGSKAIDQLIEDFNRVLAQFRTLPSVAAPGVSSAVPPPSLDARSFAMPLNEEVVSAISIGNVKAIAEQPAMLANLAHANLIANTNLSQQNAVSNQQAMNELGIAVVAKAANTLGNLSPLEARAAVDVLTNDELAQTIADLKAAVQAFTQPAEAKP